jgi:hypothetical protein
MQRNRKPSCRPRLEVLEGRWCPSCEVELVGTTLSITGDAGDNAITIVHTGPGDMSVVCDGTPGHFGEPIDRVVVRGGQGNDSVFAQSSGFAPDLPGEWTFDLGRGDDRASVFGEMLVESPVRVAVSGGPGSDGLEAFIGAFVPSELKLVLDGGDGDDFISNGSSVEGPGRVSTRVRGGDGDDEIFDVWAFTRVLGSFDARAHGGNGSDVVWATLGNSFELDPDLPLVVAGFDVLAGGRGNYVMTGGNGPDTLRIDHLGRTDGRLNLTADGGRGGDEVFANLDVNAGSTGEFSADCRGGRGDDHMEVRVRFVETDFLEIFPGFLSEVLVGFTDTPAPLAELAVTADGGAGFDTCSHSLWVTLIDIEDGQLI